MFALGRHGNRNHENETSILRIGIGIGMGLGMRLGFGGIFCLVSTLGASLLAPSGGARAAYGVGSADTQINGLSRPSQPPTEPGLPITSGRLVLKVQRFLRLRGLYLGPLDGRESAALTQAVRAFQRQAGLPVDGHISVSLARKIDQSEKIGALLRRLEQSRRAAIEKARTSLLSHPETRTLIEERDRGDTPPRPLQGQDDLCFAQPTARCLLDAALRSAKAVYKPEMRDWALGEILVSQAKAGIADDAMDATRHIQDPRLIVRALHDIAVAQARAGHDEAAVAAARIIPDPRKKIDALIVIAETQGRGARPPLPDRAKRLRALAATLAQARTLIEKFPDPLRRSEFYARLGAVALRTDRRADAGETIRHTGEALLKRAETIARARPTARDREEALTRVALAYAQGGRPKTALDLIKARGTKDEETRWIPVLMAGARHFALIGDTGAALKAAHRIAAARYRVLALGAVAVAQGEAGAFGAARKTLDDALKAANGIRLPFAKAYALASIARAQTKIAYRARSHTERADFAKQALRTATLIDEPQLRAQVLWAIADMHAKGADKTEYRRIAAQAERASNAIKSSLNRVWMFSDIAVRRARKNDLSGARHAFSRALDEAKLIDTPWDRARALAKTASALSELQDAAMRISP